LSLLAQSRMRCERLLRTFLPAFSQIAPNLPTLPRFYALPSSKPGRHKFIDEKQPNWWQLPRDLRQSIFSSGEGQSLAASVEQTPPFSHCIGKQIVFPQIGTASNYTSGSDLAREILVSYLFAAGVKQWKPTEFDRVWCDCVSYFNPAETTLEYFLYAPIAYMPGVPRHLNLGDGLAIRRLQASEMARLASLCPTLAGVSVEDVGTQWPTHFFRKRYEFEKLLVKPESIDWRFKSHSSLLDWRSRLNEEVTIRRLYPSRKSRLPRQFPWLCPARVSWVAITDKCISGNRRGFVQ